MFGPGPAPVASFAQFRRPVRRVELRCRRGHPRGALRLGFRRRNDSCGQQSDPNSHVRGRRRLPGEAHRVRRAGLLRALHLHGPEHGLPRRQLGDDDGVTRHAARARARLGHEPEVRRRVRTAQASSGAPRSATRCPSRRGSRSRSLARPADAASAGGAARPRARTAVASDASCSGGPVASRSPRSRAPTAPGSPASCAAAASGPAPTGPPRSRRTPREPGRHPGCRPVPDRPPPARQLRCCLLRPLTLSLFAQHGHRVGGTAHRAVGRISVCVVVALSVTTAEAMAKPGTFAGSLGIKVPRGAEAEIRAVPRATGRSRGAAGRPERALQPLAPSGAVPRRRHGRDPPGQADPEADRGQPQVGTEAQGHVAEGAQAQARAGPSPRRLRAGERQATPGRIAVEIYNVRGSVGDPDWDAFSPGINDLIINDVVNSRDECGTAIIETDRRAELIKQLEFESSPYVDPSSRVVRNLIIGDVEIRGTISPLPGDRAKVAMTIVDKHSGKTLGAGRPCSTGRRCSTSSRRSGSGSPTTSAS